VGVAMGTPGGVYGLAVEVALPATVRTALRALRDELASDDITAKGFRKKRTKLLAPYASESAYDDAGAGT
jgi:hypothetical protein